MKLSIACSLLLLLIATSLVGIGISATTQCSVINNLTGLPNSVDCVLDPEAVEGPYYLPICNNRRNITEDHPGIQLVLELVLMNTERCEPIENASVDLWHANATGKYSGFASEGTAGESFLRGYQVTAENGSVIFHTVYPGWYEGRCIHMHVEVFIGGQLKHTGQLYFHNALNAGILSVYPYSLNSNRFQTNDVDRIYTGSGGSHTTFDSLEGSIDSGYYGIMYIGINTSSTGGGNSALNIKFYWLALFLGFCLLI